MFVKCYGRYFFPLFTEKKKKGIVVNGGRILTYRINQFPFLSANCVVNIMGVNLSPFKQEMVRIKGGDKWNYR